MATYISYSCSAHVASDRHAVANPAVAADAVIYLDAVASYAADGGSAGSSADAVAAAVASD